MVSPLEIYSKIGLANWINFAWPNRENWSENGQWPTVISSCDVDAILPQIVAQAFISFQ